MMFVYTIGDLIGLAYAAMLLCFLALWGIGHLLNNWRYKRDKRPK